MMGWQAIVLLLNAQINLLIQFHDHLLGYTVLGIQHELYTPVNQVSTQKQDSN